MENFDGRMRIVLRGGNGKTTVDEKDVIKLSKIYGT